MVLLNTSRILKRRTSIKLLLFGIAAFYRDHSLLKSGKFLVASPLRSTGLTFWLSSILSDLRFSSLSTLRSQPSNLAAASICSPLPYFWVQGFAVGVVFELEAEACSREKRQHRLTPKLVGNFTRDLTRAPNLRRIERYRGNPRMAASAELFGQRCEVLFCGTRIPGI
jgi:hypothetical protein